MKDFNDFQKYFKEYQKRFGLTGYKVYFQYEPIEGAYADIAVNQLDMIATVRFNSKISKEDRAAIPSVRVHAKHEAIHLLVRRLSDLARRRHVSPDEIYEADEELTRRIDGLIQD